MRPRTSTPPGIRSSRATTRPRAGAGATSTRCRSTSRIGPRHSSAPSLASSDTRGGTAASPRPATRKALAESVSSTPGSGPGAAARFVPAVAAALPTAWFASFLPAVAGGVIPTLELAWVPTLGIDFAFRLDGLALAFALLVCGIGALVLLYTASYFANDRRLPWLLVTLVAFAVSMLGLVI